MTHASLAGAGALALDRCPRIPETSFSLLWLLTPGNPSKAGGFCHGKYKCYVCRIASVCDDVLGYCGNRPLHPGQGIPAE